MPKNSNPWMPASNGVFGGGGAYNKNAYSVRSKGHANNPWVQGSGWWENIVEGSFQQGFGQASHSNEYYSTEPVSLKAMRRMRIITALIAGGAIVGAAAAAGLFSGGGSAAAAGAVAAGSGGTATAGSTALGGLFSGRGILGTSVTAGQALSAAGGLAGGFLGQKLFTSHGGGMSNGGGSIPGGGPKGNTSTNSSGNSSRNPLQGRIPFNPITRSTRTRRRNEFEEDMPEDSNTQSPESLDFKNYARLNDLNNLSYAGNGSYARVSGSNHYANINTSRVQTNYDSKNLINNEGFEQNSFEYRDTQIEFDSEFAWLSMQQDNSKLPIHHKFLTTVGIDIYEEARVHGASPKGALLVLAQATLESGWGQAALKYGDFNLFGVMGTPSKRKTSHGNVKDYSNLGEYKGAVLDFFEKIERTWPNYKDLIKKNNFSSTDVDSALNTGDYFPTDSERLNGKYAYNADLDADGKNKYGKMLIKQMSYVKNRLIESIDYQITQNNIQIDMIDYTLSTIGVLSNNGKSELIKQRQTLINYNYRLTLVRIQINEVN